MRAQIWTQIKHKLPKIELQNEKTGNRKLNKKNESKLARREADKSRTRRNRRKMQKVSVINGRKTYQNKERI